MAKIRNAKDKYNSGYEKIFNDSELGNLITKIHATSISNGSELEKLIFKDNISPLGGLNKFIEDYESNPEKFKGVYIADKKTIKKSKYKILYFNSTRGQNVEDQPDGLIFVIKDKKLYIIELKDGSNFDTKKAGSEFEMMMKAKEKLGSQLTFKTDFYFCSFNANNVEEIYLGSKKKIPKENLITGRELCNILNLNYEDVRNERLKDASDNLNFFVDELLKISSVKDLILKKIKN